MDSMTKEQAQQFFQKYANTTLEDPPTATQLADAMRKVQENKNVKWPAPLYALEAVQHKPDMIDSTTHVSVKCYTDGQFTIQPFYFYSPYEPPKKSIYLGKTLVLSCGSYDGENINLFQLMDWIDANRGWINEQKKYFLEDKS